MVRIKARLSGMLRRILFVVLYPTGLVKEHAYAENVGGWRGWVDTRGIRIPLAFRDYDNGRLFFDW